MVHMPAGLVAEVMLPDAQDFTERYQAGKTASNETRRMISAIFFIFFLSFIWVKFPKFLLNARFPISYCLYR